MADSTEPDSPARDLLVTLAATTAISHAAACRLAAASERWIDRTRPPLVSDALDLPARDRRALVQLAFVARAEAARERERAASEGARLVTKGEPGYPERLNQLALPPPALWTIGMIPAPPAVAIVGSRRATAEGVEIARSFARELAEAGVVVVSGFAVGIDAAAHRGALEPARGTSVAVLGCGLTPDYPFGHRQLGRELGRRGAVVSEFPCDRQPARWQFPVRNRLIAALADVCLVVEASTRSGSLVTARWALELGREVLAVPGGIRDELAAGPNRLIADGARPALETADVLTALRAPLPPGVARERPPSPPVALDGERLALWNAAASAPGSAEALARDSDLPIDRTLALLLELELLGHLRRTFDGRYEPTG